MKELLWRAFAWVVSRKPVADYLIRRSYRTPYFDLPGYMERDWLFNSYSGMEEPDETKRHDRRIKWLPAVRIHHILRADTARHPHDHPWDARTIILRGGYIERRLDGYDTNGKEYYSTFLRGKGDTAALKYGEYHSIYGVTEGGVYTMFMTWDYKGTWGFLVNGVKIPWRQYEQMYPEEAL